MLKPGQKVPDLELPLAGGGTWKLSDSSPKNFTMLVFYRGLHCPICKKQLGQLQKHLDRFGELGVEAVAVSMDGEEKAGKAKDEWDVDGLPLAHSLSEAQAREWGLFISKGISDKEPDSFSEPGLFLIRPSGELYAEYVQSVPFARPTFDDLANGLEFILDKDYPARGTLT